MDALEQRAYFSVPAPMIVNCTDGPDNVYIRHSNELVQVYVNEDGYFRYDNPPHNLTVVVNGLGGNDTIRVNDI